MRSDSTNNSQITVVDERITERIVKNYELRLAMNLPEYNTHFEHTTIITPNGAFQWNPEIEQWSSRINAENFNVSCQELCFLLQRANEVTDPEGILSYNILTLKQLNALDQALRLHHGYTIIGYSICEEIYLRVVNFFVSLFCRRYSEYSYPPLPEAYSKRLLTFIQRQLILDIAASFRVSGQAFLLFEYFVVAYFQYFPDSKNDEEQFYNNNSPWLLLAFCSMIVMSLLFLRSGCVDKQRGLLVMIRLQLIEQSMISMILNLLNYGPFIAGTMVVKNCFLPMMILGGIMGYYNRIEKIINIAQCTTVQFLLRSFFLSLTVGSFCTLGLEGLIVVTFFLYKNNQADYVVYLQNKIIVRYFVFSSTLFMSLFLYPYTSLTMQQQGRYASNAIYGAGTALLDNYALNILTIYSIFTFNGGTNFSPEKPIAPAFYCTFTALNFLTVFLVNFPKTPNLPEYSLEKNPIEPTWITQIVRFFNDKISCCGSKTRSEVSSRVQSITSTGIELIFQNMTFFSHIFNTALFHPSIQREEPPSAENPLHRNTDHFTDSEKSVLGNC